MDGRIGTLRLNLGAIAIGAAALAAEIALTMAIGVGEDGALLIRNTVRLSLIWYVAAVCLMMFFSAADWRTETMRGQIARWCWTWAVICFLVHLWMAFEYFHHWSHTHAFERSERMSGLGEGIYIAYLFSLLWTIDAACWWLAPGRYASRSAWIDRSLHTFMLFVVLNGTIVFDTGGIRVAGVLGFALLAAMWWLARAGRRLRIIEQCAG